MAELSGDSNGHQQWLFENTLLASPSAALFAVRYVGRIPVRVSMRSLDFERRKELSRFCITVLAEVAGLRTLSRRNSGSEERERELRKLVSVEEARPFCTNANLEISTAFLKLSLANSDGELFARELSNTGSSTTPSANVHFAHDLGCVSFAAGGDGDAADFVAYVANDPNASGRACHVLECPGGLANQVVVTIGQAFELRYSLTHSNGSPSNNNAVPNVSRPASEAKPAGVAANVKSPFPAGGSSTNVSMFPINLPRNGASQPQSLLQSDVSSGRVMPPIPQLPPPMTSLSTSIVSSTSTPSPVRPQPKALASRLGSGNGVTDNEPLINFDAELQPHVSAFVNSAFSGEGLNTSISSAVSLARAAALNENNPRYENEETWLAVSSPVMTTSIPEPLPNAVRPGMYTARERTDPNEPPSSCTWYHGVLSRSEAESLLILDGEFLVRASSSSPGQYVLSGMYAGQPKHLLLVDPTGRVRTSDREFESVQTLIEYHVQHRMPIVSHDSKLMLTGPISRQ